MTRIVTTHYRYKRPAGSAPRPHLALFAGLRLLADDRRL
jgi:hypothetical protein